MLTSDSKRPQPAVVDTAAAHGAVSGDHMPQPTIGATFMHPPRHAPGRLRRRAEFVRHLALRWAAVAIVVTAAASIIWGVAWSR